MPAPAAAPPSQRAPRQRSSSRRGGRSASSASVPPVSASCAEPDQPLRVAEVLGALQLGRAEVLFHVHRGRLDEPASRPEEERGRPGGDHRHENAGGSRERLASIAPETVEGTRLRIALLSDVHGNLPAFEAVLADVEAAGVERDLVSGRSGGLRGAAGRVRGAGPRALRPVPGRQPRPRRDRSHRHRRLLPERRRGRASGPASTSPPRRSSTCAGSSPPTTGGEIGLYHASPRDPVWEYVLSTWQAGECMDAMEPRVGAVGHSHVALSSSAARAGRSSGAPAPGGTERDLSEGDWLLNPGGVGPAARRRPARGLAAAGHRRLDGHLAPGGVPDRRGGARRSRRPACRRCWPTASTRASEGARHSRRGAPARGARRRLRRRRRGRADPGRASRPRWRAGSTGSQAAVAHGTPEGCQTRSGRATPRCSRSSTPCPTDVDAEVRDALARSFDHLCELVAQRLQRARPDRDRDHADRDRDDPHGDRDRRRPRRPTDAARPTTTTPTVPTTPEVADHARRRRPTTAAAAEAPEEGDG